MTHTRDDFQTNFESQTVNGTSADSDLLVFENTYKARLSKLDIVGADAQDYELVVRNQDGTNSTTKRVYASQQNVERGSFDEPVLEWGANQELAVRNLTALSASDYGINVTIDELKGE